ncbi:ADP-ribosylglycohydrolase family protein [Lentzea tibetensis]|uniref:ADP-ribosylglycohydrolase family protein n=1 Tax=Lentzea tibetensis TaxID=2591470 RepID=UPI001C993480|nr:ADP-ribosylglycohydrolase family protein [Lentzea tibetensis]
MTAHARLEGTRPANLLDAVLDHLDDGQVRKLEAGGDVDTTAAIVGGIVGRPLENWLARREPLPDWSAR